MISPAAGVAFTFAADGDLRSPGPDRDRVSTRLGADPAWATVRQIHGSSVVRASAPGDLGEADAIFTTVPGLPVAVFTADCLGVVIVGSAGVGVAHAGWRGMDAGVIGALLVDMHRAGLDPTHAYLGPVIGSCCFEVGPEVAERFPDQVGRTTWDTTSVDLAAAARVQLSGLEAIWSVDRCTMHQPGHHSHRATGTSRRMASVGWLVRESDPRS